MNWNTLEWKQNPYFYVFTLRRDIDECVFRKTTHSPLISLFPEFGKRRPLVTVGHRIVSKQRCRSM